MSVADYLSRSCPTCAASDRDSTWRMDSELPAEQASPSDLEKSWRGFFKEQKLFFTYRRCRACGQVYSPSYFTPDQLAALYRMMDDNTAGISPALMAKTQAGYLRLLRAGLEIPPGGGYLELGPDIGLFTREAMGAADFNHYWMVEPNLGVHPSLESLLHEKPHTLLGESAEVAAIPDNSVSLAAGIHVLDHLLEPAPLLAQLQRKLRPGGVIFLVLHNQQSAVARIFRRRWPAYCLQHPQLFSPASVAEILRRTGYTNVQVRGTVNHFPVMYLLRHALFGLALGRVPVPELPAWTVALKLGNIAVMARK